MAILARLAKENDARLRQVCTFALGDAIEGTWRDIHKRGYDHSWIQGDQSSPGDFYLNDVDDRFQARVREMILKLAYLSLNGDPSFVNLEPRRAAKVP